MRIKMGQLHEGCPYFKISSDLEYGFSGDPVILDTNKKTLNNRSFKDTVILLGICCSIDKKITTA